MIDQLSLHTWLLFGLVVGLGVLAGIVHVESIDTRDDMAELITSEEVKELIEASQQTYTDIQALIYTLETKQSAQSLKENLIDICMQFFDGELSAEYLHGLQDWLATYCPSAIEETLSTVPNDRD